MNSKQFKIGVGLVVLVMVPLAIRSRLANERAHLSEPSSERLAYVTGRSVYIANPDGSRQAVVGRSSGESDFVHVRWSPDGTQIAYNADDLMWVNSDLFVVNPNRASSRLLTKVTVGGSWAWSPDSQYISISRTPPTGSSYYTLIQVDSGETVCQDYFDRQPVREVDCLPIRLPDDTLWSGHSFTGYDQVITEQAHKWALAPTVESSIAGRRFVSPDEAWVAFAVYNYVDHEHGWYIARSNGDELRTLYSVAAANRTFCYDAAWSMDSKKLAYSTYDDGQVTIWVATPEDGSRSLLVHFEEEGCPDRLKWSAGGQHIGFSVHGHWSHTYVASLSSGDLTAISPEEDFEACKWSPDGNWLGCISHQSVAVIRVTDGRRFDVAAVDPPGLARAQGRLAWSPSSRWFAVNTHTGIHGFDTVTHSIEQVTTQEVRGFAWSPLLGSEQ